MKRNFDNAETLIRVENLCQYFKLGKRELKAVNNVSFDIKKDHLPCIQLKNTYMFNPTEYVESSLNQEIEMIVTNVDLALIFAQYKVSKITYIDGYYFRK